MLNTGWPTLGYLSSYQILGITFESAQLICLDLDSLMIIHKIRW